MPNPVDNEATQDLHDAFAISGALVKTESSGTDETGRPITSETSYSVSIRVSTSAAYSTINTPSGEETSGDTQIRLSERELDALGTSGVYPEAGDELIDARSGVGSGASYEVVRVQNNETGIIRCDCNEVTE